MGFADTMRIWSNINCTLASLNSFGQDRLNGVSAGEATANLFTNVTNGFARNEVAYMMQRHGVAYGNVVNAAAGYGNPTSNAIGTLSLMSACAPWAFFNMGMGYGYPMCGYPMIGMGYPMIGCGMPMSGMAMYGVYGIC